MRLIPLTICGALLIVGAAMSVGVFVTGITFIFSLAAVIALVILGVVATGVLVYLGVRFLRRSPTIVCNIKYWWFLRGPRRIVGPIDVCIPYWVYQHRGDRAIHAQRITLSLNGVDREQGDLARRQAALRTYSPNVGATSVKTLLDSYEMGVSEAVFSSEYDLTFSLWDGMRQGHIFLAIVNSYLLNHNDSRFKPSTQPSGDHVIILTAIDNGPRKNRGPLLVFLY